MELMRERLVVRRPRGFSGASALRELTAHLEDHRHEAADEELGLRRPCWSGTGSMGTVVLGGPSRHRRRTESSRCAQNPDRASRLVVRQPCRRRTAGKSGLVAARHGAPLDVIPAPQQLPPPAFLTSGDSGPLPGGAWLLKARGTGRASDSSGADLKPPIGAQRSAGTSLMFSAKSILSILAQNGPRCAETRAVYPTLPSDLTDCREMSAISSTCRSRTLHHCMGTYLRVQRL
jgi:hypothetical protein